MADPLSTRERLLACAAACLAAGWAMTLVRRRRQARQKRLDAPLAFATTEAHRLRSAEGLSYKLSVSLPLTYHHPVASGEPPRHPVIYVLDAEPYLFPLVTVVARTNHFFKRTTWYPDFIVVGIVADLEDRFCSGDGAMDVRKLWDALRPTRARDYLPTAAESPWGAPGAESLLSVSGHATTFVRFLASTVVPFIDARYRTAKSQRALIGKSFGGSGVAHALLDPECGPLFSHFLLGSPSLSWDDRAFFRLEEGSRGTGPAFSAGVFACCGGAETRQQAVLQDFKLALEGRGCPRLAVTLSVVEGEDHGSLSYPFACRALAWLTEQLAEPQGS
mmetsp:Transcript_61527/g.191178  ORF Transcript_61527/g.191178 Transcript_61527/m.191178 type:complete len:333 (+) Transcript_61527:87-1085(+)